MLILEKLNKKQHDRGSFDCGDKDLNKYLREITRQDLCDGYAIIYVLVQKEDKPPKKIYEYFSLNSISILREEITLIYENENHKYPKIPAILICRLAKDLNQNVLFGNELLYAAMKKAKLISKDVGVVFIVVHAKNSKAAAFYRKHGFVKIPSKDCEYVFPLSKFKSI